MSVSPSESANELPLDVLHELDGRLGECLLLGAHARDHIVYDQAGLTKTRSTNDLDLAFAVESVEAFVEKTRGLTVSSDTGMRFLVTGRPVDLIPFGTAGSLVQGVVQVAPGIEMDVTGLSEAFATAAPMGTHEWLRLPTLQAMVVLKTVAWAMRGGSTNKDAVDLGLLLGCVASGAFEDRCYDDSELLGRWDADPELVGSFLTGRAAAADLPSATEKCLVHWESELLVNTIGGRSKVQREHAARLLAAMRAGATSCASGQMGSALSPGLVAPADR